METCSTTSSRPIVDRRQGSVNSAHSGPERRQFSDSRDQVRPEVREFAEAVDAYKMANHRKFITFEELFNVMMSLGYHK